MKNIVTTVILQMQNPQFIKAVYCLGFMLVILMNGLHAQVGDPGAGNPGANGEPDAAPIDGGLSLLVAAGVGYGAKKMKERKANRLENSK